MVDNSASGLLVPCDIIYTTVRVSTITWLIRYICLYYYRLIEISAVGLLTKYDIYHLHSSPCIYNDTWFIIYIYSQLTNNVIVIKTKVLLPQAYVPLDDCDPPV